MLLVLFALGLVASSQAWILEANVDRVVPGKTKDVQLVCKVDHDPETDVDVKQLYKIRIVKHSVSDKQMIAEIQVSTNETTQSIKDAIVTSNTDLQELSLTVTWSVATEDTVGVFGCFIHGYDQSSEFQSREIKLVEIREERYSMEDIDRLIHSVKSENERQYRLLELENANLKEFIHDELDSVKKQIQDEVMEVTSAVFNVRTTLMNDYATKQELSTTVSEMMNNTKDEITADNILDDMKHSKMLVMVSNSDTACKASVSTIHAEFTDFKNFINTKIDSYDNKIKTDDQQANKTSLKLKNAITAVKDKCDRDIRVLNTNLSKEISEKPCNCPRPGPPNHHNKSGMPTSTPSTAMPNSDSWPGGNYGLVKAASGCPHPQKTSNFRAQKLKNQYYKVYLQSAGKSDLTHCFNANSDPSRNVWPKGTYCIRQQSGVNCPKSFKAGYFKHLIRKKNKNVGLYQSSFCCRSDGNPSVQIKLPRGRPFYLYRFKGSCQSVVGMTFSHDSARIKSVSGAKISKLIKTQGIPDTNDNGTNIRLCLYKPLVQ